MSLLPIKRMQSWHNYLCIKSIFEKSLRRSNGPLPSCYLTIGNICSIPIVMQPVMLMEGHTKGKESSLSLSDDKYDDYVDWKLLTCGLFLNLP